MRLVAVLARVVALYNTAGLITPRLRKEVALMKKRILVLLSVVALMVVMLATSVAPAFAGEKQWICVPPTREDPNLLVNTKLDRDLLEAQGYVCEKVKIKRV
jgi:hypothetical protein